jgi:hypothetical protein
MSIKKKMKKKVKVNYFSGNYDFLVYIIKKFELYDSISDFLENNGYYTNSVVSKCNWKKNGVSSRAWAIIKKDLIIYSLKNKKKEIKLDEEKKFYDSI